MQTYGNGFPVIDGGGGGGEWAAAAAAWAAMAIARCWWMNEATMASRWAGVDETADNKAE